MCIFTERVRILSIAPEDDMAATCIFGRLIGEEQLIVYSMGFAAEADVAMVLPIPAQSRDEGAVRFVDLHEYNAFFREMRRGFPQPSLMRIKSRSAILHAAPRPKLVIHDVGDFEASFVPSISDFDRLEDRFRLAPEIWDQLPQYRDYGFVVFKLRAKKRSLWSRLTGAKPRTTHPMAFGFRTRMTDSIFFPTVHVHDGAVHEQAYFDHDLYLQGATTRESFKASMGPAKDFLRSPLARHLVDLEQPCQWCRLRGSQANRDTVVSLN